MLLNDPITGETVEIGKNHGRRIDGGTGVTRLEARLPNGRYVSHANDATVKHIRVRHHPKGTLVAVRRRGGRSGTRGSSIGKSLVSIEKAVGPRLIDATYRTQQGAKRFGRGFMDMHRGTRAGQVAAMTRNVGSPASIAGASVRMSAPIAAAQEAGQLSGRRKGRRQATAAGLVGKSADYRGDVFGRHSDVVRVGRWTKPNSSVPDGARAGRRLAD